MKRQYFDHKEGNCDVCAKLCYGKDMFFRDFPLLAKRTTDRLIVAALGFGLGVGIVIGCLIGRA